MSADAAEPLLRIERGRANAEELAALAAVVLARAAQRGAARTEPPRRAEAVGWRAPRFTGARSWTD
ncbi:acyl-CoA carboxylase epsilon subunit [Streptomyces sp. NPDC048337]|uniref:acyl-CoA carboxylase epsilon subunit n=1 Tax=Streptomyces sp. NPDC048337 TaxID=3365535 RepID=UPI003717DBFF